MASVLKDLEDAAANDLQGAARTGWRVIEGGLQSAADAATVDMGGEEVAAAAPEVGAAIVALGGWIILLAIAAVFSLFLIVHQLWRNQVKNIPIVGGPLAGVSDYIWNFFLFVWSPIGDAIDAKTRQVLDVFHTLVSFVVETRGLGSLQRLQTQIQRDYAPLQRLPSEVAALSVRVNQALANLLERLSVYVHQLWAAVGQIWQWIHTILHQLTQVWDWLHWAYHHIVWLLQTVTWLVNMVHDLWQDVMHLNAVVKILTAEMAQVHRMMRTMEQQSAGLEAVTMSTGIMTVALSRLLPLAELAPEEIQNLENLGKNPCYCFTVPGSTGNLIMLLVWDMALAGNV